MSLAQRVSALHSDAKILTLDIETQRGIWESFGADVKWLPAARCIKPPRILCFAAKWFGEDKVVFKASWLDDDADSYKKMLQSLWQLMNDAHILVTYNGDRFDLGWIEHECGVLGLGRPAPSKSVDLYKVTRKFGKGAAYKSLDWSARQWLGDKKVAHQGSDLWFQIRYGTAAERRESQRKMKEYNCHDVVLTERLLVAYLPWTPINVAIHRKHADDDELLVCIACGKEGLLKPAGLYFTGTFGYNQYRCDGCGSYCRGKRAKSGTELRAVR